jgi:glycosyltransferase involved in cell wall biosynthesis
MPAVSVILPTCDRPRLWPRALESVLRQTWQDLEVVLVDSNRLTPKLRDGPDSRLLLQDRVRIVDQPHDPSAAAARNVGLQAARGEWIAYLDDDDVYQEDKISSQLELAMRTGRQFVLCGYTVVLPRRKRTRQTAGAEFRDDGLLTQANWGTPMLFHRHDPAMRFNEALLAGEDEVFAQEFLSRHAISVVPNCPRSLVSVYPQIGLTRVHTGENIWKAYRVAWRFSRFRYSRAARRSHLAMGRLVRAQNGYGTFGHFLRCAEAAFATRGAGSWRLVANAIARRLGILSDWVVS